MSDEKQPLSEKQIEQITAGTYQISEGVGAPDFEVNNNSEEKVPAIEEQTEE